MQWSDAYSESVYTFANTINTHEGGTHEEGFRTALTRIVNDWARGKGHLKEKDPNLEGSDIREGLTAIISIKIANPQFEGQTKTKLGNSEAKPSCRRWPARCCGTGSTSTRRGQGHRDEGLAGRAGPARGPAGARPHPAQGADGQQRPARQAGRLPVARPPRVRGLHRRGRLAGGSAKQGRDSRFQAILPIRGKILNVEKARIDRVLKNAEVQALVTALGTGVQDDFDVEKLRYHKIVLMADADVDGQHIRTLLLTLLFRYMRPLVEAGFVYLAQPPLYKIKWARDEDDYVFSDRERDAVVEAGLAAGKKLARDAVQRFKGLGEMNAAELRDTTMDPDKRVLLQVTVDDAAGADELFSVLMGEDVESRRNFITRNAKDVRFLDI
jgi:DNA gyrase subunit B